MHPLLGDEILLSFLTKFIELFLTIPQPGNSAYSLGNSKIFSGSVFFFFSFKGYFKYNLEPHLNILNLQVNSATSFESTIFCLSDLQLDMWFYFWILKFSHTPIR